MIVISDTSVFTNLAAIGHLHLLQQLYERILIPTAVYQELTVDPPVPGTDEVQTLEWIEVQAVSDSEALLPSRSRQGETIAKYSTTRSG